MGEKPIMVGQTYRRVHGPASEGERRWTEEPCGNCGGPQTEGYCPTCRAVYACPAHLDAVRPTNAAPVGERPYCPHGSPEDGSLHKMELLWMVPASEAASLRQEVERLRTEIQRAWEAIGVSGQRDSDPEWGLREAIIALTSTAERRCEERQEAIDKAKCRHADLVEAHRTPSVAEECLNVWRCPRCRKFFAHTVKSGSKALACFDEHDAADAEYLGEFVPASEAARRCEELEGTLRKIERIVSSDVAGDPQGVLMVVRAALSHPEGKPDGD